MLEYSEGSLTRLDRAREIAYYNRGLEQSANYLGAIELNIPLHTEGVWFHTGVVEIQQGLIQPKHIVATAKEAGIEVPPYKFAVEITREGRYYVFIPESDKVDHDFKILIVDVRAYVYVRLGEKRYHDPLMYCVNRATVERNNWIFNTDAYFTCLKHRAPTPWWKSILGWFRNFHDNVTRSLRERRCLAKVVVVAEPCMYSKRFANLPPTTTSDNPKAHEISLGSDEAIVAAFAAGRIKDIGALGFGSWLMNPTAFDQNMHVSFKGYGYIDVAIADKKMLDLTVKDENAEP